MSKWSFLLGVAVTAGASLLPAQGPANADFDAIVRQSQWAIPTPETGKHPGIAASPAASPTTYADTKAFSARAGTLVRGLATNDLSVWRRGYFTGGDPGKYVQGPAMAKLLLDRNDAEARKYMNDDRSYKEHYHFAAVNWSRFLPIFKDALTPEIQTKLAASAGTYGSYLSPRGTENHKTMWMTSVSVLPSYMNGKNISNVGYVGALKRGKEDLREYVKGLYAAGQGEWDSSTYLMFDINGMLNIYDFAKDEETRLLAKAALDWFCAGYALKYTNGVYCAPNQRGYADAPVAKIADQTGWLWWGSTSPVTEAKTKGFLYAMHAATSSYRPPQVICDIATRKIDLPFEARNTKPNYWYGQGIEPKVGASMETVYVARDFTMGSLWNASGVQTSRFQLVSVAADGAICFSAGHPSKMDAGGKITGETGYHDGIGKYDQWAQVGPCAVVLTQIPEDDPNPLLFFELPTGTTHQLRNGRAFINAGKTFVMVAGAAELEVGETKLTAKQTEANAKAAAAGTPAPNVPGKLLVSKARKTGLVIQAADSRKYADFDAFVAAAAAMPIAFEKDAASVAAKTLDGHAIKATYQPGKSAMVVTVGGAPVATDGVKSVYASRYISQKDSILTINNGKRGFVVDFSGDLPVYRPWITPDI